MGYNVGKKGQDKRNECLHYVVIQTTAGDVYTYIISMDMEIDHCCINYMNIVTCKQFIHIYIYEFIQILDRIVEHLSSPSHRVKGDNTSITI